MEQPGSQSLKCGIAGIALAEFWGCLWLFTKPSVIPRVTNRAPARVAPRWQPSTLESSRSPLGPSTHVQPAQLQRRSLLSSQQRKDLKKPQSLLDKLAAAPPNSQRREIGPLSAGSPGASSGELSVYIILHIILHLTPRGPRGASLHKPKTVNELTLHRCAKKRCGGQKMAPRLCLQGLIQAQPWLTEPQMHLGPWKATASVESFDLT